MIQDLIDACGPDEDGLLMLVAILRSSHWDRDKIERLIPGVDVDSCIIRHRSRRQDEGYRHRFYELWRGKSMYIGRPRVEIKSPMAGYIEEWKHEYQSSVLEGLRKARTEPFKTLNVQQIVQLATSRSRVTPIPWIRQALCYFLVVKQKWSYSNVARFIGLDHTTVLYSVRSHRPEIEDLYGKYCTWIASVLETWPEEYWRELYRVYWDDTVIVSEPVRELFQIVAEAKNYITPDVSVAKEQKPTYWIKVPQDVLAGGLRASISTRRYQGNVYVWGAYAYLKRLAWMTD